MCFRVMGGVPNKVYLGGGGGIERPKPLLPTLKPINIKKLNSFLWERLKPNHKETAKFCQLPILLNVETSS